MNYSLLLGLLCIVLVSAATIRNGNNKNNNNKGNKSNNKVNKRQSAQQDDAAAVAGYELPSGVELVITDEIRPEFSCADRIYGYYADVANDCRIFHVCVPPNRMFSFFCANQTVFDQRSLICVHPNEAPPCEESENFFSINENFGVTDDSQLVKFE